MQTAIGYKDISLRQDAVSVIMKCRRFISCMENGSCFQVCDQG